MYFSWIFPTSFLLGFPCVHHLQTFGPWKTIWSIRSLQDKIYRHTCPFSALNNYNFDPLSISWFIYCRVNLILVISIRFEIVIRICILILSKFLFLNIAIMFYFLNHGLLRRNNRKLSTLSPILCLYMKISLY